MAAPRLKQWASDGLKLAHAIHSTPTAWLADVAKFKAEMDDEARRAMFRHRHEKVA